MHHPCTRRLISVAFSFLLVALSVCAPEASMAQASPFMTGATSLQTKTFTSVATVKSL